MHRLSILLLVAAVTLSLTLPTFAMEDSNEELELASQYLSSRGIMVGDGEGNMNFDGPLTRAHLATILSRIHGEHELVENNQEFYVAQCKFLDVPDWAKQYVGYCSYHGLMVGYGGNLFGAEDYVTPAAACTVILRYLALPEIEWDYTNACNTACDLGLSSPAVSQKVAISRGDLALMLYRALTWSNSHEPDDSTEESVSTVMGFCADHGGGMGWSLNGHKWDSPKAINDQTVKIMMAYFYAHSRGIFTDQAHALGVDEVWGSDYTWTMNAWVQAVVWRYKQGTLNDPAAVCAEELMYVYNNLEHTNYTSIDDVVDGTTLRDRAQYILDLGAQGVWGDCEVYEYDYAGPGSAQHPADDVQGIIIGDLTITRERYQFTIKKVDATNPNKALPGARFLVQNANGTFEKEVVTGSDGTVTLTNLDASTYSVTELAPPEDYQIDNAGPQYVVLPNSNGETVVVTFTDTPVITSEGSIRKVDADDPTKGLAGAVIKIEGVDNEFVGTYTTGAGGYLEDVPWDSMPIGSFVATEVTPPNGYTISSDPDKVRQEFYWDGKHDVDLIFEDDAKVKVQLIKLDDSDKPIEGAVFNVVKDGQIIATEATDADGSIIVPNVTEGMYAFFEVSVPAPYAKLQQPVIAHVDQATVDGGGVVTVTAVDQMLPTLTILKRDGQTGEVVPGAVFEIKGIHHGYHMDVTTGEDGTATLTGIPVDSYEVTEVSVPDPYVVAAEPTQTIWLGPGDNKQLIFDNLKQPELTIAKVDAADSTTPIPGTVFRIEAIDGDYQHDVTTGQDGTVTLRVQPGTYKITEMSVPAPYYLPDKLRNCLLY